MKKILIIYLFITILISCTKKSNDKPSTSNSCGDNPSINFKSKGTNIGVFKDCVQDVDGNIYKTVMIGNQLWMAENLKVSKYNDGTIITNIKDENQWANTLSGAWCYYNNDSIYNTKYGKLYNWYAVSKTTNGNKNVCPVGWHVPDLKEWYVLEGVLGGYQIAADLMREIDSSSWNSGNENATNTSLFTGLPSGIHGYQGFYYLNEATYWWTSTDYDTDRAPSQVISVGDGSSMVGTNATGKSGGFSVRCMKD
jgi:uncharacterized protein (TIGR02145 family)